MNLLLSDQPDVCAQFLAQIGVATLLISVDANDEFSLIAVNNLAVDFYQATELPSGTKLTPNELKSLISERPDFDAYLTRALQNIRKVRDSREELIIETDFTDRLGAVHWSRNYFTPLLQNGQVSRILVGLRDITELKVQQEALEYSLSILAGQVAAICDSCDRVKTEDGSWVTMGQYLNNHVPDGLSHSICQSCSSQELK